MLLGTTRDPLVESRLSSRPAHPHVRALGYRTAMAWDGDPTGRRPAQCGVQKNERHCACVERAGRRPSGRAGRRAGGRHFRKHQREAAPGQLCTAATSKGNVFSGMNGDDSIKIHDSYSAMAGRRCLAENFVNDFRQNAWMHPDGLRRSAAEQIVPNCGHYDGRCKHRYAVWSSFDCVYDYIP